MASWYLVGSLLLLAIESFVLAIPLDLIESKSTEGLEDSVPLVPDELPDYVNDNPIIEMDEGERRIEMDDSGPIPVCPPAVRPWKKELCRVKVCRSDSDCGRGQSRRACCYNGCVRTCMTKLEPPPFFDWDDHEDQLRNQLQDMANVWNGRGDKRTQVEFQRADIVLTLPGDCRLTQQQFDSLEQFKSSPNIRNCFCKAGDVFCVVSDATSHNSTIPITVS